MSDDISELEPPDPIPNSAVKRLSADGSVGSPHVRVGHRQAFIETQASAWVFFAWILGLNKLVRCNRLADHDLPAGVETWFKNIMRRP